MAKFVEKKEEFDNGLGKNEKIATSIAPVDGKLSLIHI